MFMNDIHQQSYLLSFEISWLRGFCNQWALLHLSVIFQYFSEWGFNMWFKIYWNTFFAKWSCVVLVCLIPPPILFAMKPKKARFFVYLGNRQIIGTVLLSHAFELNSLNMLYWKCCLLLFKYIVWDKKYCFQFKFHHKLFFRFETRTTRTPAFWGYPPPPHDYPYHWVILDPKSKEDKVKVTNLKNSPKFQIF